MCWAGRAPVLGKFDAVEIYRTLVYSTGLYIGRNDAIPAAFLRVLRPGYSHVLKCRGAFLLIAEIEQRLGAKGPRAPLHRRLSHPDIDVSHREIFDDRGGEPAGKKEHPLAAVTRIV